MTKKEYLKNYYTNNKEKWRLDTDEKKKRKSEYDKKYRLENRDKILERRRRNYQKNKEKEDKLNREYRENNYIKTMLRMAKARATKKKLTFNLVSSDIIIPEYCPILGLKLTKNRNFRTTPSLDRKDPAKGYTKDNIWVISTLANRMKSDATKEELLMFAKGILSLEGGNQL